MYRFYELANKYLNTRRSLPYVKFDKRITKKTNNEICILSYLKAHNGEAHPKELSREFIVSTPRMAVILNQLEEKGYIIRVSDSEDNRQTIVKIQKEIGERDAREFVRLYSKLMNYVRAENNI